MARSIKNLIAAILISVSCYLGWVEILPAYSKITFLNDNINGKKDLLVSRVKVIEQIGKLKKENLTKYNELQRLSLVVPEKRSFPEIITAIENIYSKNGFILEQLAPGDIKSIEQLQKIGLKAQAEGTYSQFIRFLNFFEKNIRIFDVSKIEIGLPQAAGESADPQLDITVEGQFYWLDPSYKQVAPETTKTSE